MSAALVRQALELVDPSLKSGKSKKNKKGNEVFELLSNKEKLIVKKNLKGKKAEKVNLLSKEAKYTVLEAKKLYKPKKQIIKENLEKLKLIEEACKVELDETLTKQIIERGITKRPVKIKPKTKKKATKTAFTEEDFKKFEEEYFDE